MPATASILLASPGSRAPPPASRILPRTTSSARPGGISDKISSTWLTIAVTTGSTAAATRPAGTRSVRGVRVAASMPTTSAAWS